MKAKTGKNQKSGFERFLGGVERIGNKLPAPMFMFLILTVVVIVISGIGGIFDWSVTGQMMNRASGQIEETTIEVVSLCTPEGIKYMLSSFVNNFATYPSLGNGLIIMMGIALAEYSGWLNVLIKKAVQLTPAKLVTPAVVLIGVLTNITEWAGYFLFVPLAGMIFKSCGKHPLAGIAAALAGVAGGFSANFAIGSVDVILAGFSQTAAQTLDPTYTVSPLANWYFMFVSTIFLTVVGTFVTEKIVIPHLGEYHYNGEGEAPSEVIEFTDDEKKAMRTANWVFLLLIVGLVAICIPENSFMREPETGSLMEGSLLVEAIIPILTIIFSVPGLVYGHIVKKINNSHDMAAAMKTGVDTMASFVVITMFSAQFIRYFGYSNLGRMLSMKGANFLKNLNVGVIPLMIVFILFSAFLNLFMASASAKYAVFAPIFVPMFMELGISPELTQIAYRIGDSISNPIAPVLAALPLILATMKKYDKDSGMGTLLSCTLPFSIWFVIGWTIMLIVWMYAGLPFGPGAYPYL